MKFLRYIWGVVDRAHIFAQRVLTLKYILNAELEKDGESNESYVQLFVDKMKAINAFEIQENFPTNMVLKEIQRCWNYRLEALRQLIQNCDEIDQKRSDVFMKKSIL